MRISQREARRLRQRVQELEKAVTRQRLVYSQEWFGGVNIASVTATPEVSTAIRTARRLRHAVVVVGDETDRVLFMALPHPKELP